MDASHILKTPDLFGPMSAAQIEEHQNRIFHCDMCSDDQSKVLHNLIGQHVHVPAAYLREGFPQ